MLSSVDGKISTGTTDNRDTDKDFRIIKGVKEGLQQYYELEKTTGAYSLNSGKVMKKIGVNTDKCPFKNIDCNFIILDNKHLTRKGIKNLTNNVTKLFLVTKNKKHPAFKSKAKNLELIYYSKTNFKDLFKKLKSKYKIERITIQSGGILNSQFLREGLINKISFVFAPCLIGGKDTSTLIDGKAPISKRDLKYIKALKLTKIDKLKNSYIHLQYDVIN